ncbi:uncharacterized protein LOC129355894 isoform X2 [Poeciliopsis prolifica]|uniref:uncharacterized protein LOC129355894 isoform X2 n=1 Tax=Poeciliopsis prolifica TaxID=188132 RepID=UPI0024144496|nr:uncharacterized protein LOC129355894 isoform X2 [Poeciliopsis prolifica]
MFTVTMSSVPLKRDLISGQLTPAAETFTEFREMIVKEEEETGDERRLLDFSRSPQFTSRRKGGKVTKRRSTELCLARGGFF